MKCLSVKEPWAELIASGVKWIENRTWKTSYRGPLAIHRSGENGAVIAVCELTRILHPDQAMREFPLQQEFIEGPWCWVLAHTRRIPHIPMRGRLGLWECPGVPYVRI